MEIATTTVEVMKPVQEKRYTLTVTDEELLHIEVSLWYHHTLSHLGETMWNAVFEVVRKEIDSGERPSRRGEH